MSMTSSFADKVLLVSILMGPDKSPNTCYRERISTRKEIRLDKSWRPFLPQGFGIWRPMYSTSSSEDSQSLPEETLQGTGARQCPIMDPPVEQVLRMGSETATARDRLLEIPRWEVR